MMVKEELEAATERRLKQNMYLWLWIYENHVYVNCGLKNEHGSNRRCNKHYLSSSENKAKWPNPNGFKSVDRALHRYRRGHRFKSYTGLNFFQALFSLLLNQCSLLQRSLPCSESRLLKSKVYNSNVYIALTWLKRLRKNLSCSSECPTSYLLFLLFIYCCCLF